MTTPSADGAPAPDDRHDRRLLFALIGAEAAGVFLDRAADALRAAGDDAGAGGGAVLARELAVLADAVAAERAALDAALDRAAL